MSFLNISCISAFWISNCTVLVIFAGHAVYSCFWSHKNPSAPEVLVPVPTSTKVSNSEMCHILTYFTKMLSFLTAQRKKSYTLWWITHDAYIVKSLLFLLLTFQELLSQLHRTQGMYHTSIKELRKNYLGWGLNRTAANVCLAVCCAIL